MRRVPILLLLMMGCTPIQGIAQSPLKHVPFVQPEASRDTDAANTQPVSRQQIQDAGDAAHRITTEPTEPQNSVRMASPSQIPSPIGAGTGAAERKEPQKTWLADAAALLGSVAWPTVALIIVFRLLKMPQVAVLLTHVSRRVTEVSVAGVQLKLSEGAAATLDDLKKLLGTIPETHQEWVKNTHVEEEFQLVISDFRDHYLSTSSGSAAQIELSDFGNFRFTLHVPDVLLTHSLRQLVDYVGDDRGGGGRMFSSRRGIIGLAWRLQQSQHKSHAPSYSETDLIEKWGMTRAEAKDTKGGRSVFLAFVIRSEAGLPLALFYADAKETKLFDSFRINASSEEAVFANLERIVLESCKKRGLQASLEQLEKVRVTLKQVDLYKVS
jgi:hypothetical protein